MAKRVGVSEGSPLAGSSGRGEIDEFEGPRLVPERNDPWERGVGQVIGRSWGPTLAIERGPAKAAAEGWAESMATFTRRTETVNGRRSRGA